MLIENDADVNIKNGDGNTALDIANEEGKEQQWFIWQRIFVP